MIVSKVGMRCCKCNNNENKLACVPQGDSGRERDTHRNSEREREREREVKKERERDKSCLISFQMMYGACLTHIQVGQSWWCPLGKTPPKVWSSGPIEGNLVSGSTTVMIRGSVPSYTYSIHM